MGAETTCGTGRFGTSEGGTQKTVSLEDVFTPDPHARCIVSSGRKKVLLGRYTGGNDADVPACAAVYEVGESVLFGTECANLARCSLIGVGPRMLAIAEYRRGDEPIARPVIIEEDVGDSLARIFAQDATGPGEAILHPVGTPEREAENEKIAFDVLSQALNAHDNNLFHCDLRAENVCVRRFGERPEDIRATLIDVDLGAGLGAGRPAHLASLYDVLFREVPTYLAGGATGTGSEAIIVPSPLELDLGYLAALLFHVERGDLALNSRQPSHDTLDEFLALLARRVPFFGYDMGTMTVVVRRLDAEADIRPIGTRLGLREVCEGSFPTKELLEEARLYHRLYLDALDMKSFEKSAVARMHAVVNRLAHVAFDKYNERNRAQGRTVAYERFEDQPEDLQSSNYDQMAHVLTKVAGLGYTTVELDSPAAAQRVRAFTDEQIEILARMEHARWVKEREAKGWTLGDRSAEAKTSPYLVPYDELEEDIKEYDRGAARDVIPFLELAGMAVVRP